MKNEDYTWLLSVKHVWIQNVFLLPVKVKLINVDLKNKIATIKTILQQGEVSINKLFKTEKDCPSR